MCSSLCVSLCVYVDVWGHIHIYIVPFPLISFFTSPTIYLVSERQFVISSADYRATFCFSGMTEVVVNSGFARRWL